MVASEANTITKMYHYEPFCSVVVKISNYCHVVYLLRTVRHCVTTCCFFRKCVMNCLMTTVLMTCWYLTPTDSTMTEVLMMCSYLAPSDWTTIEAQMTQQVPTWLNTKWQQL